jgi:hypothetical protein
VYFRDPINSIKIYARHDISPIKMKYTADDMGKLNYYQYRIKISKSTHVQGDPLFDCTEYSTNDTYNQCVQKELIDLVEKKLGCAPPLIAGHYNNTCNKTFNLTATEDSAIMLMFWDIYYGTYKPEICKDPCTHTSFKEYLMFKVPKANNDYGFTFDSEVAVTRSTFSVSSQTFLTRLGGTVSCLSLLTTRRGSAPRPTSSSCRVVQSKIYKDNFLL